MNPNQKRWKGDETRRVHWLSSTTVRTARRWSGIDPPVAVGQVVPHLRLPSCQLATPTGSIHPLAVVLPEPARARERETPLFRAQRRRLAGRGRSRRPSRPVTTVARGRRARQFDRQQASAVAHTAAPATHRPRPDQLPRSGTGRRHASATVLRAAPRYATCCTPPARPRCVPACRFAGPIDRSGQSHADALLHRTRLCVARRAATG